MSNHNERMGLAEEIRDTMRRQEWMPAELAIRAADMLEGTVTPEHCPVCNWSGPSVQYLRDGTPIRHPEDVTAHGIKVPVTPTTDDHLAAHQWWTTVWGSGGGGYGWDCSCGIVSSGTAAENPGRYERHATRDLAKLAAVAHIAAGWMSPTAHAEQMRAAPTDAQIVDQWWKSCADEWAIPNELMVKFARDVLDRWAK